MKFFSDCSTLEEVKAAYRKLAVLHHPDRGGDTATMQELNKEYAFISARIIKGENLSPEDSEKEMQFSEEYRAIIEKIIHLPGIVIELVGLWLWVTGNTYPIRAELKEAGLLFAPKKQAWYYRSEPYKVSNRSTKSLGEIRAKYGSETISKSTPYHKTLSHP